LRLSRRVSNDIPAQALVCDTLAKQGGSMPIELKADAVRLFAEIGFLGLSRGHTGQAETIFDMLRSLRPGEEAGAVGMALTALAADRPDSAIKALKSAQQTATVIAFSALAHARLGEVAAARALVEDLEAMGAEATLLDMAQGALGKG
jgi:hypothetical protein